MTKVEKDERTVAIENSAHKVGYTVASFLLLIDIALRSYIRDEAPWDLFGIVIGSSLIVTIYQAKWRALSSGWLRRGIIAAIAAAIVAGVVSVLR